MKIKTVIESVSIYQDTCELPCLLSCSEVIQLAGVIAAGVPEVQQLRQEWPVCGIALGLKQARVAPKKASLSVSILD